MSSGTIIFDFDGTLCDSLSELRKILNELSPRYGYVPVTDEMVPLLRGKGTLELIHFLKVPLHRLPSIARECRKRLSERLAGLSPFPGLDEELRELSAQYRMGILSSNSEENIRAFLEMNGWNFFSFIYSGSSLFGKTRLLKRCLLEQGLDPRSTIYVGDEVRDIDSAKRAGVKSLAVGWGFHSEERLLGQGPHGIISSPSAIQGAIRTFENS